MADAGHLMADLAARKRSAPPRAEHLVANDVLALYRMLIEKGEPLLAEWGGGPDVEAHRLFLARLVAACRLETEMLVADYGG